MARIRCVASKVDVFGVDQHAVVVPEDCFDHSSASAHGRRRKHLDRRPDEHHQPLKPTRACGDEPSLILEPRNQRRDLCGVPIRPRWLRQQIIDEINASFFEERQRLLQDA